MYKIAIISKGAELLKDALDFNLDGNFEIHTFEDTNNLDSLDIFDLSITDISKYDEVAQFFDSPIDLNAVIRFIHDQYAVLDGGAPSIDKKSRVLSYMGQKIELTQQAADILQILIFAPHFKLEISIFAQKLGMVNINFEAIKTGVYRVNQRFVEYGIPLKILLHSKYILLEKL